MSANGGYSWGRCVRDAEWDDRYLPMVTIDNQGYLVVGSGVQNDAGVYSMFNDVWRSSISFDDLAAVSTACGVEIPACGVGLRCWPGAETVVGTDGSFVSCAACPHASLAGMMPVTASDNGDSVTTVVMVAMIVVSVVLLAALWWLYNKMHAAGVNVFGGAGSSSKSEKETELLGSGSTDSAEGQKQSA